MSFRHAIVIGATSGIGQELARQLAMNGCKVAAIGRRQERLEAMQSDRILTYALDVTEYDKIPDAFLTITHDLGGLDLLIYAAGVMPSVGETEYDFAKDKKMVDVNLLGCIAWCNQAAIRFGNVRHGTIVAIGSVAGDRGRAGQPVYNASKAALATYMEALRNRLSRLGVTVVTVKPGPVDTEMTHGLKLRGALTAEAAAKRILGLIGSPGEKYLKFSHRIIFAIIRAVPSWIFRRIGPK
ncbi:MAG: hypothetical protein HONBIEJF_00805 [Fimbriimonadaceae bacterium]|nr:hypothetical protein [Fimbriimonadaceae bacterium]